MIRAAWLEHCGCPSRFVPLELPPIRKRKTGRSRNFYQLVRTMASREAPPPGFKRRHARPMSGQAAISWASALGFRIATTCSPHGDPRPAGRRHQCGRALGRRRRIWRGWGKRISTWFYIRDRRAGAQWLCRIFDQPLVKAIPSARGDPRFHRRGGTHRGCRPGPAWPHAGAFALVRRSVDSTYLTGKSVFVFGDATHAVAARESRPKSSDSRWWVRHLQP